MALTTVEADAVEQVEHVLRPGQLGAHRRTGRGVAQLGDEALGVRYEHEGVLVAVDHQERRCIRPHVRHGVDGSPGSPSRGPW